MNTVYRVTGRYMTGSEISAYHLVDENGSTLIVNRDKAILMISRGQIENMRVQYSGDDVIIRGKGINLNKLPVYDLNKAQFRGNNAPQSGTTKRTSSNNPMSQYRITKRIMYKTSCVGYVVQDASGREFRLTRDKTVEFAVKGLILNAEAQKYTPAGSNETKLLIRGINCDIRSLPTILVDMNGNSIDTSKKNQSVVVRATQIRRSGIIYKNDTKSVKTFSAGDYIVCTPTGGLNVLASSSAKGLIRRVSDTSAIGDTYLENLSNYSIEFFGSAKQGITAGMVKNWPIVAIMNPKERA